jgi:serine/threonine protein kinase
LKPENLLMTDDTDGADVKLVDFGLAVKTSLGEPVRGVIGTPQYMAPEIFENKPYG